MHIILVSNRLATARSITLTWKHLWFGLFALMTSIVMLSSVFSYLTVRHAAEIRLPFLQDLLRTMDVDDSQRSQSYMRENLNAMAVKLGQMQAQLLRLDSVGERLAGMAGIKPQDLKAAEAGGDGRGGPLLQPSQLSSTELQHAVNSLAQQVEAKSDAMSLIESQLLEDRVRKNLLPTSLPVMAQWNASTYGWRIDPFTGERAMHEGVDFVAEPGTPIHAAAAGIVIRAEMHPQYGNLVEIDHGRDITTRYAHASAILVKPGQFVRRGQIVARVGTSGRSTGPHLHFEVRVQGIAQNPDRFLRMAEAGTTRLARLRPAPEAQ
ncbi:MAG: peptidase M23 [Betaproteobacteria bacterium HGW-Betaproteobacteria-11]|nr:MAG: peptidase M23 [Betaproteobacteria bacterium HGW-Betaproteobacteria-11]